MISYEEALKKAKSVKPGIDNCAEYENGFVFGCYADGDTIGKGPCVILKKDGRAVTMPYFLTRCDPGECLREFDLD